MIHFVLEVGKFPDFKKEKNKWISFNRKQEMSKGRIIVDAIANVIATAHQECILQASSQFTLQVDNTDTLIIKNMNVTSNATTSKSCTQTTQISLFDKLDEDMDQAVRELFLISDLDQYKSLKINIRESITVDVVNKILAIAIAGISIKIKNVKDTVKILNLNVIQEATATIRDCLQYVQISNSTLKQYLDINTNYITNKNIERIGQTKSAEVAIVVPKDCTAENEENTKQLHMFIGASVSGIVFLFLICTIGLYVFAKKLKK